MSLDPFFVFVNKVKWFSWEIKNPIWNSKSLRRRRRRWSRRWEEEKDADQERKGLVCGTVIIDIRRRDQVEDERHHSFRVQLWKEESIRKEGVRACVRRAAYDGYCCVWNARWWERLIIFLLCVPFAFESIWIRHFDQVCLLLLLLRCLCLFKRPAE